MSDSMFVEEKPMAGTEHAFQADAVIGREGCDIVLADPEVSRRHATLREGPGGPAVEDLGSTNGTYVNGERITGTRPLRDGDTVRFGNTVWRLKSTVAVGAGAQATAAGQVVSPPPTAATAAPPPTAPPAAAPVAVTAAPPPPRSGGASRGDVPAPTIDAPSAVRRVLPPPKAGQAPAFSAPSTPKARGTYGTVARRVEMTVFSYAVVLLTLAGLVVYFVTGD